MKLSIIKSFGTKTKPDKTYEVTIEFLQDRMKPTSKKQGRFPREFAKKIDQILSSSRRRERTATVD